MKKIYFRPSRFQRAIQAASAAKHESTERESHGDSKERLWSVSEWVHSRAIVYIVWPVQGEPGIKIDGIILNFSEGYHYMTCLDQTGF